jgi:hypothetical protein
VAEKVLFALGRPIRQARTDRLGSAPDLQPTRYRMVRCDTDDGVSKRPPSCAPLWAEGWVQRKKRAPIDARKGVGWRRRFLSRSGALLGSRDRSPRLGAGWMRPMRYRMVRCDTDDGVSKRPPSCAPLWAEGWVQQR